MFCKHQSIEYCLYHISLYRDTIDPQRLNAYPHLKAHIKHRHLRTLIKLKEELAEIWYNQVFDAINVAQDDRFLLKE